MNGYFPRRPWRVESNGNIGGTDVLADTGERVVLEDHADMIVAAINAQQHIVGPGNRYIVFRVFDTPKPGGSKRGFVVNGRVCIVDASKNKDWRSAVKHAALEAIKTSGEAMPLRGPLKLDVTFFMPRPKSHYRTGKNAHILRDDAPGYHTSKPDATKLLRSTEDALTGVLWNDDAEIAVQVVTKQYGQQPGALIEVWGN